MLNGYFSYYINNLASSNNEYVRLNMANSFWAIKRSDIKIKDDFINVGKNFYNAEIWNKPFNKSVVQDINSWVNDNTDGMIDRILSDGAVTKDTVAILLNAVAFDAEWDSPYTLYDVTENEFHNYDGSDSKADFMREERHSYFNDSYSLGFVKDYRMKEQSSSRYCFVAILPNEDVGIDEYIEKYFTAETITEGVNNQILDKTVNTKLPKFDFDYSSTLNDSLKNMGIETAFNRYDANFSNMTEITEVANIYLSKVLHKAHITVDEQGTKAAAATAFDIMTFDSVDLSEPINITLDRPFIFAIYDYSEEMPVFIGTVMNCE